jgi:hypothetical protein
MDLKPFERAVVNRIYLVQYKVQWLALVNTEIYRQNFKDMEWIHLTQYTVQWRAPMNTSFIVRDNFFCRHAVTQILCQRIDIRLSSSLNKALFVAFVLHISKTSPQQMIHICFQIYI